MSDAEIVTHLNALLADEWGVNLVDKVANLLERKRHHEATLSAIDDLADKLAIAAERGLNDPSKPRPVGIVYIPAMEDDLQPWLGLKPLRAWAADFAAEVRSKPPEQLNWQGRAFSLLCIDGLITGDADGAIAFHWYNSKRGTAPGWNEPHGPAATWRLYARKAGAGGGI